MLNSQKRAKKQLNKEKKEQEKKEKIEKAKAAKREAAAAGGGESNTAKGPNTNAQPMGDVSEGRYGKIPLITSSSREGKVFTRVEQIDESKVGQKVVVRARLHSSRIQGNSCFLVLRQRQFTLQCVMFKGADISKQFLNFAEKINKESIIDVEGEIVVPQQALKSTTQQFELKIWSLFVVTSAIAPLPIQIEDAARPAPLLAQQKVEIKRLEAQIKEANDQLEGLTEEEKKKKETEIASLVEEKNKASSKYTRLSRSTRLDNRVLDLRTPANQAIFLIQSGVGQLFREFLYSKGFMEIHSPKLIGCASEGGANVFKLGYFEGSAYLAQSPQLYKQMGICSDFERVFEVGPVFRSENSLTHRHLCEFVGLDLEMAFNEHYHEVLDLLGELFIFIFEGMESRYGKQLDIVREQFPFEPLKFKKPTLRLEYPEAVKMLRDAGVEIGDHEDLSTPAEKKLGALVKEKYDTDFYMLDKFPTAVRPFYTMPDPNKPGYSNAYDFFIRGEEIMSGGQRIHDPDFLIKRCNDCGVDPKTVEDYVNSFKYGILPHAGGGIGLERVVMLSMGLKNIRQTSLFPRDPKRLTP
eukprot:TRINITY_DN2209_c0_g1_i2.p1 TRINITY_DN2209_c0_g1~~TRINITY_DN2209_c0_g1_i2.p1  ORF type:complete len:581 (-),score=160.40 TRINITY_DN2209_c0_g1_i2:59-1801(-)